MDDFIESFLLECEIKGLSPYTIRWYRDRLYWFERNYDWSQDGVNRFIKDSLHKRATATINNVLRAVKSFSNYSHLVFHTPEISIKFLKEEDKVKEIYTSDELRKLLKKPNSKDFTEWKIWALENLLVGTGCRITTALNVRVEDIDFDSNTILFSHNKNHKQQLFPLSDGLKRALKLYLAHRGSTGFLICNSYGDKADKRTIQKQVADYNKARGVEKTSCHLFRHTFGSTLAKNNVNAYNIMCLMNHSSMDMVNKYIHNYGTILNIDLNSVSPLDTNLKEKIKIKPASNNKK